MDWETYKSWFIGPKAENRELFKKLINSSLDENIYWRKNFHPEDNLNQKMSSSNSREIEDSRNLIEEKLAILNSRIKNSPPFFSPRYMGHMKTESVIAAYVGYFTGMLYDNNNTCEEAAPSTLALEAEAVEKLCRMASMPKDAWGYITTGGTSANFQCLWRARDTRFFPYLLAVTYLTAGSEIKGVLDEIALADGEKIGDAIEGNRLHTINNVQIYQLLEKIEVIIYDYPQLKKELEKNSLYQLGYLGFDRLMRKHLKDRFPKSFKWLVNKSVHFSIKKSLNFLGFGDQDIVPIELNQHWQMDIDHLQKTVDRLVEIRDIPIGLIAIFGSTEVGATDNFHKIADFLQKRREEKKSDMWLHSDLAWGGYYLSLNQPERVRSVEVLYDLMNDLLEHELQSIPVSLPNQLHGRLKDWVEKYLTDVSSINESDSITVDPHKTGFTPYACGVCLFKNYRVRDVASYSSPYINVKKRMSDPKNALWDVPEMAQYTLEGSRASVGATSLWMVHETIPLDINGMGHLMARSVLSALLFQSLLENKTFHLTEGCSIRFSFLNNTPMTGVTCYTFEILYQDEVVPLKLLNKILSEMFDKQALSKTDSFHNKHFILTKTVIDGKKYHHELSRFLQNSESNIQLTSHRDQSEPFNPWRDDSKMVVLRNVLLDPFFLTCQCQSSELETKEQRPIIEEYADYIVNQLGEITKKICNERLEKEDRVQLLGNLMIVDDNLELTSLLKMMLCEDFVDSSPSLFVRRSTAEAVTFLQQQEVRAVVTGLDLGPGEERGGVAVLKEAMKKSSCKGAVLFTTSSYAVSESIFSELLEERPDWKLFYLPHFELTSDTSQFTINRLEEMVWKIINAP